MKKNMWTSEITVEFVPLPPEREEAYWAAIRYFAEVMFSDIVEESAEVNADETIPIDLEKKGIKQ